MKTRREVAEFTAQWKYKKPYNTLTREQQDWVEVFMDAHNDEVTGDNYGN